MDYNHDYLKNINKISKTNYKPQMKQVQCHLYLDEIEENLEQVVIN